MGNKLRLLFCLLSLGLALGLLLSAQGPQEVFAEGEGQRVLLGSIKGAITPAQVDLLETILDRAQNERCALVLLQLDTPGGLVDSARSMMRMIRNASIPVAIWVGPDGARAASAGVFLVAASHVAGMAYESTIGAASPVGMGGKDIPETMQKKVMNDLMSMLRSMLESSSRNIDWYMQSVESAVSITSKEAIQLRVVEFLASDPADFVKQLGKRGFLFNGEPFPIDSEHVEIIRHDPGFRHSFLSWLLNPQIAYLLFLGGLAGLFFELSSPGAIFPGVFGGLCLLFGLYAMSMLPTNIAGILLILFGLVLFLLEIKIVSYGLLSLGVIISLAVGSLILFPDIPGVAPLSKWTIGVTVLGVSGLLAIAVYAVAKAQVSEPLNYAAKLLGQEAEILNWSENKGRVFIHGESWSALSSTPVELHPGDRVIISAVQGLTLQVESPNQDRL